MQKRIHHKNWNPKINQHELYNIFGILDSKQLDLRKTKPNTWFQHMLEKAKRFNEKYIKRKEEVNNARTA